MTTPIATSPIAGAGCRAAGARPTASSLKCGKDRRDGTRENPPDRGQGPVRSLAAGSLEDMTQHSHPALADHLATRAWASASRPSTPSSIAAVAAVIAVAIVALVDHRP